MTETKWSPVCTLCAARGKPTRLDSGHACPACMGWLASTLATIGHLVADAAACLVPPPGTGSGSRPVPSSRPPIDLDAVDPANVVVAIAPGQSPTLLECVEAWERLAREMRGMAPYGPASASRIVAGDRPATRDEATLYGVLTFLGRQVPWMATDTGFPIEDFADELRACLRAVRRWDTERASRGFAVPCPTLTDDGDDCGYRLRFGDGDDVVACRRCGVSRDVETLVVIGMSTKDHEMWVDAEVVAVRYGIPKRTLQRMAERGQVRRDHGRYLLSDVAATRTG